MPYTGHNWQGYLSFTIVIFYFSYRPSWPTCVLDKTGNLLWDMFSGQDMSRGVTQNNEIKHVSLIEN